MARLYVALFLLALTFVIVLQNTAVVTLRFLFWERSTSQVLVLFITAAGSFLAGFLIGRLGGGRRT